MTPQLLQGGLHAHHALLFSHVFIHVYMIINIVFITMAHGTGT